MCSKWAFEIQITIQRWFKPNALEMGQSILELGLLKNRPSRICERRPLKNLKGYGLL